MKSSSIECTKIRRLWPSLARRLAAAAMAFVGLPAIATTAFPISKPYDKIEKVRLDALKTCDEVLATLKTPPRTESFAPKWQRRLALLANLPAYAWNVASIFYRFDDPGFKLEFEQGPFQGWDASAPVHLRQLRLIYRPAHHHRYSLTRKLFGPEPRVFTIDDIVSAREGRLDVDDGTLFSLELKLNASGRGSVIILISRDSGLMRIYESDNNSTVALAARIGSLWSRTLGAITNFNLGETPGTWFTSP